METTVTFQTKFFSAADFPGDFEVIYSYFKTMWK